MIFSQTVLYTFGEAQMKLIVLPLLLLLLVLCQGRTGGSRARNAYAEQKMNWFSDMFRKSIKKAYQFYKGEEASSKKGKFSSSFSSLSFHRKVDQSIFTSWGFLLLMAAALAIIIKLSPLTLTRQQAPPPRQAKGSNSRLNNGNLHDKKKGGSKGKDEPEGVTLKTCELAQKEEGNSEIRSTRIS